MIKKRNQKGEGHWTKLDNGKYQWRKVVGKKLDGKDKVIVVTGTTKSECREKMKLKESEWNKTRKRSASFDGLTLEELCHNHLVYQMELNELKPKSIDRRETTIKKHIGAYTIGKIQVVSVTSKDIDDHVNYLIRNTALSVSSIEKVVDVIKAAYDWAMARGELYVNPVLSVKKSISKRLGKIDKKKNNGNGVKVLSQEEIRMFIEEAEQIDQKTGKFKHVNGIYGLFLLYTGMRCGEACSLKWKDYDEENNILTIDSSLFVTKDRSEKSQKKNIVLEGMTKNDKIRKIQLSAEAINVLNKIKIRTPFASKEDFILTTKNGTHQRPTNMIVTMNKIYKAANIEGVSGTHIFRRTFATMRYLEGWRLKEIAEYIGDLESTTQEYYISVHEKIKERDTTVSYIPFRN